MVPSSRQNDSAERSPLTPSSRAVRSITDFSCAFGPAARLGEESLGVADRALAAAKKGFAAWSQVSAYDRYKTMRKAADIIRGRADARLTGDGRAEPAGERVAARQFHDPHAALPLVLWEALAGRRLFLGESDYETVKKVQPEAKVQKAGAALLKDVYEDGGLRPMSDLDILVPRQLGAAAYELAREALGYVPSVTKDVQEKMSDEDRQLAALIRPGHSVVLELHTNIVESHSPLRSDIQPFWDRAVPRAFGGAAASVLALEHHLAFLCNNIQKDRRFYI